MKRNLLNIAFSLLCVAQMFALDLPKEFQNTLPIENPNNSCFQVLYNNKPLINGAFVTKASKGVITVENSIEKKITFNLVLKTNINKKNQPPIFLRFVKVDKLELQKVLDYAAIGDEIYIEQFMENTSMKSMCSPSKFVVS